MSVEEISNIITSKFGEEAILGLDPNTSPSLLEIPTKLIAEICLELHVNELCYFDFLSCITGIDNGPDKGTMEVVYNLYSIPYDLKLMLKVTVPRNKEGERLPSVPTVSHIWKTADWHEREIYDLVGINFLGHQDLRRILLPADWEGHPLRRDYKNLENYHGIVVD
ncbi:MAG: NADH-quinone oxidoreductase subunit C [Bacteroidota bacterium]|nr:NADH-quinone oxidoreductase subunit C [Bacteroidota bacterium]